MSTEPGAGLDRYAVRGEHWGQVIASAEHVYLEVDGTDVADFTRAQARAYGQALIAAAGDIPADEIGSWSGYQWRDDT